MTARLSVRLILGNAALFGLTLVFCLLLAEGAWYFLVPPDSGVHQIPHPTLYATEPPSMEWTIETAEYTTHMRTNAAGFRGPELPLERDPEISRLLFIGDSFLEAKQVEEEDRFSDVVGEILGPDTEVYSLGLDGAGPWKEYLFYRELGRKLQPDTVILSIYPVNDYMYPNDERFTFRGQGLQKRVDTVSVVQPDIPKKSLYDRMRFLKAAVTFFGRVYDRLTIRADSEQGQQDVRKILSHFIGYTTFGLEEYEEDQVWETTMPFLKSFQEQVEVDGSTFLIVVVPSAAEIHADWREELKDRFSMTVAADQWDFDGLHNRFVAGLDEWNIPYIDLRDAFRAEADDGYLFFKRDPHFNEKGHKIAADEIVKALRSPLSL